MFLTLLVTCLISIFIAGYFFVKKKYSYFADRHILFSEPSFPFGNLKGIGTSTHVSTLTTRVYDKFVGKDVLCGLYFFLRPSVMLLDPELIKNVMVKDFNNFINRGVYHNEEVDPLSGHLFSIEGTKWKNLRAKITPTFTSGKMKMMFETVVAVAEEFKKCVKEHADAGDEFEIKDVLARFSTDVIGTCAFGIDCNSIKDPNAEFRLMGKRIFEPVGLEKIKTFFVTSFPNVSKKLSLMINNKEVSDFFLNVVRETIDYREKNKVDRKDFMHLLLEIQKLDDNAEKLTFHEIAAQCFVFFAAGFETSSTTMTFSLYELAMNQEFQHKAREEIQRILAKHDGKLTYEAASEMPYLDQIING